MENGLVLVNEINEDDLIKNDIDLDKVESIEVVRKEKIELEGLDKKMVRLEKIGAIVIDSINKFLMNMGIKDDRRVKLQMNENIKAFASAA